MAVTNIERFTADLKGFQDVIALRADLLVQGVAQEVLNEVQVGTQGTGQYSPGTPVDTGYARASWQGGIGAPVQGPLTPPPERGNAEALLAESQRRNATVLQSAKAGDTIYLTNPVPYMPVLEYGGYPNPVKLGTRNSRATGFTKYEIRSTGGFSAQAPNGFVRIALAAFQRIAEDVATAIRDTLPRAA